METLERLASPELDKILGKKFPVLDDGFVRVVDYMGNDAAIVQAARVSYGKGTKKLNEDRGLIRYLMRHRHSTPMEMCLHGDTKVPTLPCHGAAQKQYTIRELAEASGKSGSWVKLVNIRTVNPNTGVISKTKISRAWKSGVKKCFRVTEASVAKRSIVITDNHPLLCPDGKFRPLSSLSVGDRVCMNGIPATSTDIENEVCSRRRSGEYLADIAKSLSMPPSTVQKILQRNGLGGRLKRRPGFLKKPIGERRDPRAIARGVISYLGDCMFPECGKKATERHHVDENPHNNDLSNLMQTCSKHHRVIHNGTMIERVVATTIASIEDIGEHEVFDLEVKSPFHSFVADGFAVHNCELKLHVKVPMDHWRQWIRHRTANVNEYSTRYSEAIDSVAKTDPKKWRYQSGKNKQGSSGYLPDAEGASLSVAEESLHRALREAYEKRLELGVAREQARKDLSLSTYTEAYWKIDLHNLIHFLSLRMDAHAQEEIRAYATVIGEQIVAAWVPFVWEAFMDYRFHALTLSRLDIEIVKATTIPEALSKAEEFGWLKKGEDGKLTPNRERDEFEAKADRLGLTTRWFPAKYPWK